MTIAQQICWGLSLVLQITQAQLKPSHASCVSYTQSVTAIMTMTGHAAFLPQSASMQHQPLL